MKFYHLLIIAFIEGGYILAIELLGAKMIASYYGSSLIIWTAVLGVALTFLTVGYFLGGKLSQKKDTGNTLFSMLMLAAFLMAFMPHFAPYFLKSSFGYNIYIGVILSGIVLLGPPLTAIGTISPLLIQAGTERLNIAGKISGIIYAISTIGGILSTFLLGFYIIPQWGITMPSFVLATLLGILSIVFFFDKNKIVIAVILILVITFDIIYLNKQKNTESRSQWIKAVYESEGILGQLKVLDSYDSDKRIPIRRLLINGIPQTNILLNPQTPYSFWNYVHFIAAYSTLKTRGSDVLLLGFGGGSIATELVNRGFNVEVVDLDSRMIDIAKNYFFFNDSKINFMVDDARHYIETTKKKYELIVIDLLNGEVQPSYVFSVQGFNKMKEILKDSGMIVMEQQGYLYGNKSKGMRSIYKTIQEAGYYAYYKNRGGDNSTDFVDVMFIASRVPLDFSKITLKELNYCCKIRLPYTDFFRIPVSIAAINTDDVMVLDDDAPILDQYNAWSIIDWRKTMIESVTNPQLKQGIRLFK